MYKSVVKQALVYTSTINVSIGIAEKGMGISRNAADALALKGDRADWIVQPMLDMTREALEDVKSILESFRSIRISLYEVSLRYRSKEFNALTVCCADDEGDKPKQHSHTIRRGH